MDIHIESAGTGQALLFLHAGVADSRMWEDQLREFSKTHRVIAFDQRGFGKTAWTSDPYSDVKDSLAVLDALGIESAVVIGCSMGGGTALELAISHPERVDGIVVVGAFPGGWQPPGGFEESPLEEEAVAAFEAGDLERLVEIDLKMWLVGYGRSEDEVDPVLMDRFRDMDRVAIQSEAGRNEYRQGFSGKLDEHLDQIDVPALVMVGAHDEPLLLDAADYLAERLSDLPALVIEDAAHLPSLEQPERFNTSLKGFLSAI